MSSKLPPASATRCTEASEAAALDARSDHPAAERGPVIGSDRNPRPRMGESTPGSRAEWAGRMAGATLDGAASAMPALGSVDLSKIKIPALNVAGGVVDVDLALAGKLAVKATDPFLLTVTQSADTMDGGKALDLATKVTLEDLGLDVSVKGLSGIFTGRTVPSVTVGGEVLGAPASITVGKKGLSVEAKGAPAQIKIPIGDGLVLDGKAGWILTVSKRPGDTGGGGEHVVVDLPLAEIATALIAGAAMFAIYRVNPAALEHAYATGLLAMPGGLDAADLDPRDPLSPVYNPLLDPV